MESLDNLKFISYLTKQESSAQFTLKEQMTHCFFCFILELKIKGINKMKRAKFKGERAHSKH